MRNLTIAELAQAVSSGDTRAVARAATLIEQRTAAGRELVACLFPKTGRARIIGVTGPPGAGKSTLVNQFIKYLRSQNRTVAVIAVDPSSPYTQGALLGDRVRMSEHHADPGVFIRSMATRGQLGGIAPATLDIALLLDAAGFESVFIETVGVGQDELDVVEVADLTLVVLAPASGDDVQAIKAGIMEAADVFVINKADLPGAERLEQEIRFVQSLSAHTDDRSAPVQKVVANQGSGVASLLEVLDAECQRRGRKLARSENWTGVLRELVCEKVLARLSEKDLMEQADRVAQRMTTPEEAAEAILLRAFESRGENNER